jgi:hypothetical protein
MENIEYAVGEIELSSARFVMGKVNPYMSTHKFVVSEDAGKRAIYVSPAESHFGVVERFGLNQEKMIGGGSIYIDEQGRLIFAGNSACYGTISNSDAKKFGELIAPELKKIGIPFTKIVADTSEWYFPYQEGTFSYREQI